MPLSDKILATLRQHPNIHVNDLRARLGYPCPIEFSMTLTELVESGAIRKDPPEVMLPRYAVAGEVAA